MNFLKLFNIPIVLFVILFFRFFRSRISYLSPGRRFPPKQQLLSIFSVRCWMGIAAIPWVSQINVISERCVISQISIFTFFIGGPASDMLLEAQLPVVSNDNCNEAYSKFKSTEIDNRVICAGFAQGGKDACQVIKWTLSIIRCFRFFRWILKINR